MMRTLFIALMLPMALSAAGATTTGADESWATTGLETVERSTYQFAVRSFREHRYAAAYGRFAKLADAGHPPSAQLALVMYRHGPTMFGQNWDATPEQLERWSALVVKGERTRID
jgi:hypothetical protein